ncbi:MAG: cobyrinate a,c-diamide synthase [Lachnospiraceae bacterium]|nr:cobyrinate a,c-diamide synthase [Lachnospiraceae bacterium]
MADSRIMIAGACSGSGKTMITCGLMRIFKEAGLRVAPFKCGPDYIDPMYHRVALGMEAQTLLKDGSVAGGGNLDTYFTDRNTTIDLLYEGGYGSSDIAIIEGVMGLYDGLGGTSLTGSSYELAHVTKTPIILVVDAKGMGRSILALIKGFLDYDEHKLICGIILNRVSKTYYEKLKVHIEDELGITVTGYVPDDPKLHVGSRHLGLMTPTAAGCEGRINTMDPGTHIAHVSKIIESSAGMIRDYVNIRVIRSIADKAERLNKPEHSASVPVLPFVEKRKIRKMAVAIDEAFCFYYRENLRYLKAAGIEFIPFSPLHDTEIPENIDAIMLGGGYPEEYLKELSNNIPMLDCIRSAAGCGIYIIAECGGFMYLQEAIEDRKGMAFKMAGVLPGICRWKGRLTRFGYVELSIDKLRLRGHEFHYYDSDSNGEDVCVTKASTGRKYKAMYAADNILAGFAHLYYRSGRYNDNHEGR